MPFTTANYELIRSGCRRSAAKLVPILGEIFQPHTVIDLGCGEGWWLREFALRGCEVLGVDAGEHAGAVLAANEFQTVNLASTPDFDYGRFDLAISLEVAEHLPPQRAGWFVDTLARHADHIVFSAAVPGQGGIGHLNEQWPSYWAELFDARGFSVSGSLRWTIWHMAPDDIENWYAQNLLIASRHPENLRRNLSFDESIVDVIHPVLWRSRQ